MTNEARSRRGVFISSTRDDLRLERQAVIDALRRVRSKHRAMEIFGARPGTPVDSCLEEVRRSSLLLLLVAYKYGSLVPGLGISYTEAEYSEARRLAMPCLVYFRDDEVPIRPTQMENDAKRLERLIAWKEALRRNHTISIFATSHDLASQVCSDVPRTLNEIDDHTTASSASSSQSEHLTLIESLLTDYNSIAEANNSNRQSRKAEIKEALARLAPRVSSIERYARREDEGNRLALSVFLGARPRRNELPRLLDICRSSKHKFVWHAALDSIEAHVRHFRLSEAQRAHLLAELQAIGLGPFARRKGPVLRHVERVARHIECAQ